MKPQKNVYETLQVIRWKTNFHGKRNRQIDLDFNALWSCAIRTSQSEWTSERKKGETKFLHNFNEATEVRRRNFEI